jgi:hypothetical protein
MIYDHYGYQPLPQHAGPWFFSEQVAHLEIAIHEQDEYKPRTDTSRETRNNQNTPFEETKNGKLYAWLKAQNRFVSYSEMGEFLGRPSKYAVRLVSFLYTKGYPMLKETRKNRAYVKML